MEQLLESRETETDVDLSRAADDFDSVLFCGRCGERDVDLSRAADDFDSVLFCGRCGERFRASEATDDGWYYRCPNEDCDAEGIHEELYPVKDVLPSTH